MAPQAGKVRYIGFTGHKDPADPPAHAGGGRAAQLHLRCRADAAERDGRAFRQLRQECCRCWRSENIGVLGMKPMGTGVLLQSKTVTADRVPALRPEPADLRRHHRHATDGSSGSGAGGGAHFQPMTRAERAALLARRRKRRRTASSSPYKTTTKFDGTAHNPQWLG